MGGLRFSISSYQKARMDYGVSDRNVTKQAEYSARISGRLNEIVDPAINPIRMSKIRLDAYNGKWISTVGCPMDIEVSCDTTGSMGSEVDNEMKVLPDLYAEVSKMLPEYDPQLCIGIFGDCGDRFVMCRPQFEMEAPKIVNYLKEMAPQRGGCGNYGEDPQYAMFARAYLTDTYINRIGLKGYHFIVTDEPYHNSITEHQIKRIFGDRIFENELADMRGIPTVDKMVEELKRKAHQFILVLRDTAYEGTVEIWRNLCGSNSVIVIDNTTQLPKIISAIIGLTEGTLDISELDHYLEGINYETISQLCRIDVGAQVELRNKLDNKVPKAGDIFLNKSDTWPTEYNGVTSVGEEEVAVDSEIDYV